MKKAEGKTKEVEKELAKRSHFCQKVIKRLKQQVKDLEAEKAESGHGKPAVMGLGSGGTSRGKPGAKAFMGGADPSQAATNKANEDLINFLEHKLEEIESSKGRFIAEAYFFYLRQMNRTDDAYIGRWTALLERVTAKDKDNLFFINFLKETIAALEDKRNLVEASRKYLASKQ